MQTFKEKFLGLFNFKLDASLTTIMLIGLVGYIAIAAIVSTVFGMSMSPTAGYTMLALFASVMFYIPGAACLLYLDEKAGNNGFIIGIPSIIVAFAQFVLLMSVAEGSAPAVVMLPGVVIFIVGLAAVSIKWLSDNSSKLFVSQEK